jgi:hypothetical protein
MAAASPAPAAPLTPGGTAINQAKFNAMQNSIAKLLKRLQKAENSKNNLENKLNKLKKYVRERKSNNNDNRHGRRSSLKESETPYFTRDLRRYFYNPYYGFYVKIYNPVTGKLVSVPTRGIFAFQNVGNRIVRYRTRRLATLPKPNPKRAKRNTNLNAALQKLKKAGYLGVSESDPKHKHRHSYR